MNRRQTGAQPTAASANLQSTQKARAPDGTLSSGPQRAGAADAPPPTATPVATAPGNYDAPPSTDARQLRRTDLELDRPGLGVGFDDEKAALEPGAGVDDAGRADGVVADRFVDVAGEDEVRAVPFDGDAE